jgi:tetratricopeptide (TPR) repeat protein
MIIPNRFIAAVAPILAAAAYCCAETPAAAIWCANYNNGGTNCGFHTQEQCRATVSGVGGSCSGSDSEKNIAKPAARKQPKAAEPKPKRKEQERGAPAERSVRPPAVAQPAPAPPVVVQPPNATAQQPANNFQSARALIAAGRYEDGIAAMKALGYDDHPDIASAMGYANAQLRRFAEARKWYDRALAADPGHLATLVYSGALHVAQSQLDQARADLARIKTVCGNTTCPEHQQLERLIAARQR